MWGWGCTSIADPTGDFFGGLTIEDFLSKIQRLDSVTYFHNLKFDGHFIADWLLNNGYTHTDSKDRARKGEFKSLISDQNQWYSITVTWRNGFTTEFRDSLKKIPLPVARVAKAYNLEDSKGEIDYHSERPVGYEPTAEEWEYIRLDVMIVALAMQEVLANGMSRLTVGSDALAEYKSLVGTELFQKLFPVLADDMDAEIRRAYRGGFTYASPRFTGCVTRSGIVFDVNSLYPSVMYSKALPYGEPEFFEGKPAPTKTHPLTIFSLTFEATLKPGHIPCIQIKGSSQFGATEYLTEINEPTTLMMTDVDLALYQDHYDFNIIEYGGGWRFKAATGMFKKYIDKWSKIKENESGGKREIAKLFLNSLYGKFATNPNVQSKIPTLVDGKIKMVLGAAETRPPVYTPVGVFITSYARNITVRAAQENYDTFAYADTDSLHLLQDHVPATIDVHPTRMGAWKKEYKFQSAFYIRPKAYLERHYDDCGCGDKRGTPYERCKASYTNAIAGLPVKITESLTFADMVHGKILHGKLTPETVPGGIILKDVEFKLKLH